MSAARLRGVSLILDMLSISGAAGVIYGLHEIYAPLAWIAGGTGSIVLSYLLSKRMHADADGSTHPT